MKKFNRNILHSIGIIMLILLFGLLITQDDPKGIGRMIIYIIGSFTFSISGLIAIVMILIKRIKIENVFFLTSLIGNLFYIVILNSEITLKDGNVLIAIFGIPIIVGIIELIILIKKRKITSTNIV